MEFANSFRVANRIALTIERNEKKKLEHDRRRLLDYASEPCSNVTDIANKLKTKASVKLQELLQLKNALLTEVNIQDFMKTHGALRGLVRELTGSDTGKQIAAAACLCNLSLSEAHSAQILTKATGSYLLLYLHSHSTEFAITCAWTIGNLAGSHERVCDLLISQGALKALSAVFAETTNKEVEEAICYALVHIGYQLQDNLEKESCCALVEILKRKPRYETCYQLLFILSCHSEFLALENLNEEFLAFLLEDFYSSVSEDTETAKLKYIIRVLANICVELPTSDYVLNYWLDSKHCVQVETVLLSKCSSLRSNMVWLLGNVFNSCTQNIKNVQFFEKLSDTILKL